MGVLLAQAIILNSGQGAAASTGKEPQ